MYGVMGKGMQDRDLSAGDTGILNKEAIIRLTVCIL